MGWTSGTENYAEGHNGCLTYPLGTDKWMDRWDSGKSLCHWKKGWSHFPSGQSMAMLDMCDKTTAYHSTELYDHSASS